MPTWIWTNKDRHTFDAIERTVGATTIELLIPHIAETSKFPVNEITDGGVEGKGATQRFHPRFRPHMSRFAEAEGLAHLISSRFWSYLWWGGDCKWMSQSKCEGLTHIATFWPSLGQIRHPSALERCCASFVVNSTIRMHGKRYLC